MLLPLALAALTSLITTAEPSPSDATVFIRVVGVVRAEYQRAWKETRESRDVEVATGSGFVVSPAGYVLTNRHVVSGEDLTLQRNGETLRVNVEVKRIEVVFPADGTRLEARVDASDPDLDLAVLSISGGDLPFIGLGDSDALEPGQPVHVIGFPFGRQVEVGRAVNEDTVPQPTVSRGTVGALRGSDEGEARYIQTDAPVYPGSSGGPMLDEDGHAIGVIRMRLDRRSGPGPAFAVPINRVKDFLEASSLERIFPARLLRLGPLQSFDWKGLRFRLPDGFDDRAPSRLRVEWAPTQEVAFLVQRVASPLGLSDLEGRLRAGHDFPGLVPIERAESRSARLGGRAAVVGRGHGLSTAEPPTEVGYAVVDLGKEKVMAAYLGPPAQVAFNRSVLDGWLGSLEADPLLVQEVSGPVPAVLEPASLPHQDGLPLVMPQGWYHEPTGPSPCRALPVPDAVLLSSPEGDFTVSLRAAWWRSSGAGPEQARAACTPSNAAAGSASYALRRTRLGVTYAVEGVFLPAGDSLLQLEVETPDSKQSFLRDLFAAWTKAVPGERQ